MTEEHKNKIVEMLMADYNIKLDLAQLIVKVFVEDAKQIIKKDAENAERTRKDYIDRVIDNDLIGLLK